MQIDGKFSTPRKAHSSLGTTRSADRSLHFDSSHREITPGWWANRKLSTNGFREEIVISYKPTSGPNNFRVARSHGVFQSYGTRLSERSRTNDARKKGRNRPHGLIEFLKNLGKSPAKIWRAVAGSPLGLKS
jgi:hypothetical protein